MRDLAIELVRDRAESLGFDLVSAAPARAAEADLGFLQDWCAAGKAADMAWLARDPARRTDPAVLLPGALSVISLGVSYHQGPVPPPPARPAGRVARYAWGEDYHEVIGRRLRDFADALRRDAPGLEVRPAVDAQPLLERAFARQAGLGFVGKNTNLIVPGAGSWFFLAELVVNAEVRDGRPAAAQGCGGCTACQVRCPTGALDRDYTLDARLCVSYQTIENRGWVPRELRGRTAPWLFGCDDCQEACPFNARAQAARWPEFSAARGVGPWVDLAEVLSLRSDESFLARFRGTPLTRARRAGLVRNACLLAAGREGELRSLLEEALFHDPSPVVRGHAAWALGQGGGAAAALERARGREIDPRALEEIEAVLA